MDEFENKEQNGATPPIDLTIDPVVEQVTAEAEAAVQKAEAQAQAEAQAAQARQAQAVQEAEAAAAKAAQAAAAPGYGYAEPPHAPEPPSYESTQQQYGVPQYQPPQYQPPQYDVPPQGQPNPYGYQYNPYNQPPMGYRQKSRLAAGLLGIFFGCFGVHNFYLGFNSKATVQLLVSIIGSIFTCGISLIAVSIWGLVEGIQILSGSEGHMYDGNGVILRD